MSLILLILALSFSFITRIVIAANGHRGDSTYGCIRSEMKKELSKMDLSSDSSAIVTSGYSHTLPKSLLKSEFFSPSVQSVLNYHPPTEKLSVVFATTADSQNNTLSTEMKNTLLMLKMYSQVYPTRCVVFSSTPSIISYSLSCGHTVVTNTSLNPFGFPFIRPILEVTRLLFDSAHISYINSDILFSSSLFDVLKAIPFAHPPISPIYEVAMTVRDMNRTVPLTETTLPAFNSFVQSVYDTGAQRHIHSSDIFVFSQSTPFRSVEGVVVGRMSVDNALMGIMYKEGGELISVNDVLKAVHQGVSGYIQHQKENKATWKDVHWNNIALGWNSSLAGYKQIIRQGSLRYCNRIAYYSNGFHFKRVRLVAASNK